MTRNPTRIRRVQLAVPASNERMMAKAAASAADHVFLDLEDSVAASSKVAARESAVVALRTHAWGKKTRCIRINDLTTKYAYEDVLTVVTGAREHLDTVMVPKVLSGADIHFVHTLLHQVEQNVGLTKKIGIEVLIEEVQGLQKVDEICTASDRLECVIFGMGDYSASHGIDPGLIGGKDGYPGDIWHYARFRIVMAARAAGVMAVDGPFADFRDDEAFREECRRAMALGFSGKWAIHPRQIEVALEVFTPKLADVERARRFIKAYAEAELEGKGSIQVDGTLVDAATIRMLNKIIQKADLIGM